MKTNRFSFAVSLVIMALFLYTATSKLIDFPRFRWEMYNQVFNFSLARVLVYLIPTIELLAAGLLMFKLTRLTGLALSLILFSCFTFYTAAVLLHVFPRVPCICGGLIASMDWTSHLILNGICTALLFASLGLEYKQKIH